MSIQESVEKEKYIGFFVVVKKLFFNWILLQTLHFTSITPVLANQFDGKKFYAKEKGHHTLLQLVFFRFSFYFACYNDCVCVCWTNSIFFRWPAGRPKIRKKTIPLTNGQKTNYDRPSDPPTEHFLNQYYIIPHGICTLIYWIPSYFLSVFFCFFFFSLKKQKDHLQLAFYLLLSFSFQVL